MITVSSLHKKFDQRGIAGVHNVNLGLEAGEILALLGPNGSGKTTLLNLISGKLTPDSGTIELGGEVKVHGPRTVDEGLRVHRYLEGKVTTTAEEEKKVQLVRDFADLLEFTSVLKQNLSQLSSGQRQKVILAGELINRPALLLLDEPFTHLDPFTRKDILRWLFKVIRDQEVTLIWVTHDLPEAFQFSSKVAVMNFGNLEQVAVPYEVSRFPRNLFVAQFIGYQNFIPVKKANGSWETPWGRWDFNFDELDEGYLVVPTTSWVLGEVDGLEARLESYHNTPTGLSLSLSFEGKEFTVEVPAANAVVTLSPTISLKPKWADCFMIPL